MLAGLEESANRRAWGIQEELLADTVELVSSLLIAFMHANTKDGDRWRIPDPIHIRRPGEEPKTVSMGDVARSMLRG